MARGEMFVENAAFGSGVEILNRPPFEGVSMTIDFDGVSDEADNGELVVKAGTPIDGDGKAVTSGFENVAGILLVDVYEHRPQGTILKKAYINETVAQEHSGVTYDETLKGKLPMIVFE